MMWTEGGRGPRAGMVIHQILMEQVHIWVWHEELERRPPTTLSQPPTATESQRRAEFTPRDVGTGATGNEEGRILCHADQQNQCADSSCSVGAHGFAMMVHDSCHDRSMERPTCSIGGARCRDQEKQHIRQIFAVNTMNFHLVVGTNFQSHTRYCWLSASVMHLLIC